MYKNNMECELKKHSILFMLRVEKMEKNKSFTSLERKTWEKIKDMIQYTMLKEK